MQLAANVTKVGIALVAFSLVFFVLPMWLGNHCYYDWSFVLILFSFVVMLFFTFHPRVLAYVGAADFFLYFATPVEEREAKFRGTLIRSYTRYVLLAASVYMTSMMRQTLVMVFTQKEFSYSSLVLPLYLMLARKQIFGGNFEEYLARYVSISFLVIFLAVVYLQFNPGFDPEHSCRMDRMLDEIRESLREQQLESYRPK